MIQGSQNLHSHTLLSDGKMAHRETLDIAAANGCAVVAFTDHDTLMLGEVLAELKALEHKTKWVSGVELSLADPGGAVGGSYHLIGLFVDPGHDGLRTHCVKMKEARIAKARGYVKMFTGLGFKLTLEECLAQVKEGTIGKPHVVAALIARKENLPLLNQYIEEFRQASLSGSTLATQYAEVLERSKRYDIGQFVYPIFLRPNSFIKSAAPVDVVSPSLEEAAALIRAAGGVTILAHWNTVMGAITPEVLEGFLREKKIDGMETVWGLPSSGGYPLEWRANRNVATGLVEKYSALSSASIDAHLPADYELFGKSDFFAAETVGAVEKIIERSGVSTRFSTL